MAKTSDDCEPGDDLDAEILDQERASALDAMADAAIADLDVVRAIEHDAVAASVEPQLADLEREMLDTAEGSYERQKDGSSNKTEKEKREWGSMVNQQNTQIGTGRGRKDKTT